MMILGIREDLQHILCKELQKQEFRNTARNDSYTTHHWHKKDAFIAQNGIDVEKLIDGVKVVSFHGKIVV